MPRFETAWFLNDHSQWEIVSYAELRDEVRRAYLRERDLRDEAAGQISLGIRNHETTPHFFEKRRFRGDIDPGARESVRHQEQQRIMLSFLQKYKKYHVGYYERPWNKKDMGFDTLEKLKDYQWGKEVEFGLVYGKYIRFDILGRSSDEIELTDKAPYFALEIVDTHFHSQEAFKTLLALSRNIPITIGYYFISVAPRENCVNKPEKEGSYSKIRLQFHISDGSFWRRNERAEELYKGITPDRPEAYYNLIKEQLYAGGYIGH